MTSRKNLTKSQREMLSFIDGRGIPTKTFQTFHGSAISIDGIGRMDVLCRLISKGLVAGLTDKNGMTWFNLTPEGRERLSRCVA